MNKRASITGGVILILLGLFFLAREIFPDVFGVFEWPFIVIGVGVVFILAAILSGQGGLAIPGTIIGGIGGILYAQSNLIGFNSWSYMWALIPGLVGLGIILSGIIDGHIRGALSAGLTLILISLVLFFIFGGSFGLDPELVKYWPVILIALGVITIIRLFIKGKRRK